MITLAILYPKTDDSHFDMDYYTTKHMPMLAESLGAACHGWGASAVTSGKYACMGWAMIESAEALGAAMTEHGAKIMDDVANYTNVQPELIVGDVVV